MILPPDEKEAPDDARGDLRRAGAVEYPLVGIVAMLAAAGAEISEGRGSRVRISLRGVDAVFHRPHPRKETDKGAVRSMRRFLTEAGLEP